MRPDIRLCLAVLAALALPLLAPVATAQVLPFIPPAAQPSQDREAIRSQVRSLLEQKNLQGTLTDENLDSLARAFRVLSEPAFTPRLSLIGSGAIYTGAAGGNSLDASASGAIGLQLISRRSQWTFLMSVLATEPERRSDFSAVLLSPDAGGQGLRASHQRVISDKFHNGRTRENGFNVQAQLSSTRWQDTVSAASARVTSAGLTVRLTHNLFQGDADDDLAYSVRFEAGASARALLTGSGSDRSLQRSLLGSGQRVFLVPDIGIVMRIGKTALQGRLEWIPALDGQRDIADVTGWRFTTGLVLQPELTPLTVRFR